MKRVAKVMLAEAKRLADELQRQTGLAVNAGLDDHLLNSFVILAARPEHHQPGKWFEYLNDSKIVGMLRTSGIVEFYVEIENRTRILRVCPTRIRLRPSPTSNREEFVSENIQFPLPSELDETAKLIVQVGSKLRYSVVPMSWKGHPVP